MDRGEESLRPMSHSPVMQNKDSVYEIKILNLESCVYAQSEHSLRNTMASTKKHLLNICLTPYALVCKVRVSMC